MNVQKTDKKISFQSYFENAYGEGRWHKLKAALMQESQKPSVQFFPSMPAYTMDVASLIPALALKASNNERVLDMCAAPGGKTLALLHLGVKSLIANELSSARRKRLTEVIQKHVPQELRMKVEVKGKDAVQYGLREENQYDAVLLDVPCSSERHHLASCQTYEKDWTLSKTQSLSQRQYALLCAALLAVKPEGRIVYSTCSISPLENDAVIGKLFKKKSPQVKLLEVEIDWTRLQNLLGTLWSFTPALKIEATEFGYSIFPDQEASWNVLSTEGVNVSKKCLYPGPIYFSLLQKLY